MKRIHYQNFGYPKTGTTWLWVNLMNHSEVDHLYDFKNKLVLTDLNNIHPSILEFKENYKLIDDKIPDYREYINWYSRYNVSINFPVTFNIKQSVINRMEDFTTHGSMIIRNPYELLESWGNFTITNRRLVPVERDLFYKTFSNWLNLPSVIAKWKKFGRPFKILYYDDLKADPIGFYHSVCDFIGISIEPPAYTSTIYPTPKTEIFDFDIRLASLINTQIKEAEILLDKDLSHWLG